LRGLLLCWREGYAKIYVIIEIKGIVYNFKCEITDIKTKWCLIDKTVGHSQTYVKYSAKSYVIKEIKGIVWNFKCDVTDLKKEWLLLDITMDHSQVYVKYDVKIYVIK
jgi:acetolactate synthase small subunit